MNDTTPYSIYVDQRPLRIAYFVDESQFTFEQFKNIYELNQQKWGGAYNPIIPLKDGEIAADWLSFLKSYDPDVIDCLWGIDESKIDLDQLDYALSPFLVRKAEDKDWLYNDGIGILPTKGNVSTASGYHSQPKVALFEFGDNFVDDEIIDFIGVNWGYYERTCSITGKKKVYHRDHTIERALSDNETQVLHIDSEDDLYNSIEQMAGYETLVYPNQISSLAPFHKEIEPNSPFSSGFIVIVGESPKDLILYNNLRILRESNKKKTMNYIWIPSSFTENEKIMCAIQKYIQKYAQSYRPSDQKDVQVVSFSLKQNKLQNIAQKLKPARIPIVETKLTKMPFPWFRQEQPFYQKKSNTSVFTGRSPIENLVLNEPKIAVTGIYSTYWVADICLENTDGKFLKLPSNNQIAQMMFGANSRMRTNGFPSLIMQRGTAEIKLSMPNEDQLFRTLLLAPQRPTRNEDLRSEKEGKVKPYKVEDIQFSDKGKYFQGVVDLFGSLYEAYRFFSDHFWRDLFEIHSKKDNPSGFTFKGLKKAAKEEYEKFKNLKNSSKLKPIAINGKKLINMSEEELEQLKKEDFEGFVTDIQDTLSFLINQGVLILGTKTHCPVCGLKNWKSIDQTSQNIKCEGCRNSYGIEAEPEWFYRLNNIIAMAIKNGIIPAIILIGELLQYSKEKSIPFFFPNVEVLKANKREAEIDILCINDGKFLIGEVKRSFNGSYGFKERDFKKIEELAIKVKPDSVIFAALDKKKPNDDIEKWFTDISNNLEPLGINVVWHNFYPIVFEPSIGSI